MLLAQVRRRNLSKAATLRNAAVSGAARDLL